MKKTYKTYVITETWTYHVEAESEQEAESLFLADPEFYAIGVEERSIDEQ